MSNINETYPFEEQLLDQGTGLLGMVEDRNRLLKSMYRQDLFQDFLLAEKLQSLDDTGGLDVQPISRKGFDLSPVNELAPNTIEVNKPSQQSQPKQMRQGGVVGNNPIIDMLPDSSGTYQPQTNKQTESLAEAGVTNDLTKVTGAVLDDFKIDDKLAKAFSESMALPARAAAVALADLLSKISIPGSSDIVKTEVQKVSSSFNIPAPSTGEEKPEGETKKDVKTKSIGELMVLYGVPIKSDNDCQKAVNTAIEMFTQLEEFNSKNVKNNLPKLDIGVGINYGEVVSGNIGSTRQMNYTVIGDSVNLAARLCSHAEKKQIVISDSSYQLLSQKGGFIRKNPINVKGKKNKIENWVLDIN